MDFQRKIDELLYFYKALYEKYNNEISLLPKGHIISCKRGNNYNFFLVEEGVYERKSITKDKNLIKELFRKRIIEESVRRLEKNIVALERVKLEDLSYSSIYESLGKAYKRVHAEVYADDIGWDKNDYIQSTYKPENKKHTTSHGLKVRSKSEVIIAETLYAYDVPFRYEQILNIEGREFAPDFTIMTPFNKVYYWEHCGMTHNQQYMDHHKWKLEQYEKVGIVPWKNLIVTYDGEEGIIDTNIIRSEILNKLR